MFTDTVIGLALLLATQSGAPTVEEVRRETRTLLQSMCGAQCDVIDVAIRNAPRPPRGAVAPGFDDTAEARMVPTEVSLTLLFDTKLTKAYRDFVRDRVQQRIGELGLPVKVNLQARAFPEAPPEPVNEPPPMQGASQPQQPAPIIIQPPQPQVVPPKPESNLEEAFWLKLIEALPAILLFGLLAMVLFRVLKRLEDISLAGGHRAAPAEPDAIDAKTITPEIVDESPRGANTKLPAPTVAEMSRELELHRGSTRRIFRRLLVQNEYDLVARAVAVMGEFVVQDLGNDPALRPSLLDLGDRTASVLRTPLTEEQREELLRAIRAELVADRVAHRGDDVRPEFEPLLGWSPEAFVTLVQPLDDRERVVLLRHAPQHLTESYLRGLDPSSRAAVVRELLEAEHATPEEIEAVGESIAAGGGAALVGGYESDHIVDLLEVLPADEQETVVTSLESVRPDFVRRRAGQLPVESALLRVPDEAFAGAWATVPFEDWLAYLRAAPADIRARAIASCPPRLKESLSDELGLRVAPDPAKAEAARRRIIRAVLRAAGAFPGEEARRALAVVQGSGAHRKAGS